MTGIMNTGGLHWEPPGDWDRVGCVDMHTGGEPLRILVEGIPEIQGRTILDRRKWFREHLDGIRTGTMLEPRGHADMYGAVITPPETPDGDFGVFFLHNEGYSTMCGHAIIALSKFVLDTGFIERAGEEVKLNIDTPAGRIVSTAYRKNGMVDSTRFRNVPSFVLIPDASMEIQGLGEVQFTVAFGGAYYAIVDAESLGIGLGSENAGRLISLGRLIRLEVQEKFDISHPFEDELGFLYGTIFTGRAEHAHRHSRNVCIFADGELDRSATGTGVSARAAIHYAANRISINEWIEIESITGSSMKVRVVSETKFGPYEAVIPEVEGRAHFTGMSEFWFDPSDPVKNGFLLRG
jgi:trans-L-3-hydroxyproline dehydratase